MDRDFGSPRAPFRRACKPLLDKAGVISRQSCQSIAFAATMVASSALNNLFVTYYIDIFTRAAGLTPAWFYIGQTVFMLWNAVNDPLFGWISDRLNINVFNSASPLARRTSAIKLGGALWCLAFLLVWWPWAQSTAPPTDSTSLQAVLGGMHLILSLCTYDGMLTFVELNHSALLAEMTERPEERAQANMYSGIAAAIGSLTSYIAYLVYDVQHLAGFRAFAVIVAVTSFCIFQLAAAGIEAYSTSNAKSPNTRNNNQRGEQQIELANVSVEQDTVRSGTPSSPRGRAAPEEPSSYINFLRQLIASKSFVTFAVLAALQSFDCAFEKNFYAPFMDRLTARPQQGGAGADADLQTVSFFTSKGAKGMFISASFLLPHVLTVLWTPIIRGRGIYYTLRLIFGVRLVLLAAASGAGRGSAMYILMFMLLNRVLSESVCRLFPLVLSDLIDEDTAKYRRDKTLSASVVGSATFVSKFGQSLAPIITFTMLPELRSHTHEAPASALQQQIWGLLLLIPGICVAAQLLLWLTRYDLKGAYLSKIKREALQNDE